ncbi:MAG: TIGR02117 family protein [Bacteroidia bacterium]
MLSLLKIFFFYISRFIFSFICFLLLYLFMSWLLPYIRISNCYKQPEKGIEIFVQSNGVHTDFVLPVKSNLINWNVFLPYADFELADPSFQYISFGWGDKGFFINTPTWADLKFSTAFNAAFGLGSTAMHVAYKRYKPKAGESCKEIIISEEQYKKLIRYILVSFKTENKKPALINHAGYTSYDRFYEAQGSYSMFNTCNVWTGNGLRYMNVDIGAWTPFQGGIIDHLK